MAQQAQQSKSDDDIKWNDIKWNDIPPTPPTTFPKIWFIGYCIMTTIILPIHLIVCIINGAYKILMYIINFIFYYQTNKLLVDIKCDPSSYIIITGAASGIGKDISLLFAAKGFSLILIDISSESLQNFTKELENKFKNQKFKSLVIDLSKDKASKKIYNTIINEWKILNIVILVNCAGFGMTGDFLNQNINKIKAMINVNAICCVELGQLFGKYFVKRGYGRILQIASVASFVPGSHCAVYHATKSFIRNWAMAFQHELIGTGVGLTIMCPGPVNTKFKQNSNSDKSLIFGALKWFTYQSIDVAQSAVNATLNGKRQIVYGPLWSFIQNLLSVYGEAYNIIAVKFMWQDPKSKYRSPFKKYVYK